MKISIDYYLIMLQANRIADEAGNMKNKINQLDQFINQIRAAWAGPASETFIQKCEQLKQEMLQTQRKTVNLADSIKSVADHVRREDEEAKQRTRRLRES
ncbi:WXG100 family type VII secretion target [Bacillus sp. FJAT-49705]|uniref:WXG100 family type VII secretion target n=1 Tax=Cytobacillus citreus TaxID=2833586 RepID=A0ABS5NPC2_9BACI|nr:WXG100 family type VII secretion target [Cytobacillus citreus]MBS4189650.1 WXG100 family type VII secretion target [Cytobacillus citreus]